MAMGLVENKVLIDMVLRSCKDYLSCLPFLARFSDHDWPYGVMMGKCSTYVLCIKMSKDKSSENHHHRKLLSYSRENRMSAVTCNCNFRN